MIFPKKNETSIIILNNAYIKALRKKTDQTNIIKSLLSSLLIVTYPSN